MRLETLEKTDRNNCASSNLRKLQANVDLSILAVHSDSPVRHLDARTLQQMYSVAWRISLGYDLAHYRLPCARDLLHICARPEQSASVQAETIAARTLLRAHSGSDARDLLTAPIATRHASTVRST